MSLLALGGGQRAPGASLLVARQLEAAIELLEAATRCRDADLAHDALDRIVAAAGVASTDWARGVTARSRALLSEGEEADGLYREAAERLGRTPLRPELARTHLLYGEWLSREGRRVDAGKELRAAHDLFVELGMGAFAERTGRELLAPGESVRKRTLEASDDLTALQIARLAREGLSNPQIGARFFLSPRSVEWHLRKVFSKLGIRSRRELADALARHDGGTVTT